MATQKQNRAGVAELLFPCYCLLCGVERNAAPDYLCRECAQKILRPPGPVCALCAKELGPKAKGDVCADCRKQPAAAYKAAYAPTLYCALARTALIQMKSARKKVLLRPMAAIMTGYARRFIPDLADYDLLAAVPMHWTRLLVRGFNHAEELARLIGPELGVDCAQNVLRRRFRAAAQKSLPQKKRLSNATAAFRPGKNSRAVSGRKVLLIDDIRTTGATARECSRIIMESGAEKVSVLVFSTT